MFVIKAFAKGGSYYTNGSGQKVRYTATNPMGRRLERRGTYQGTGVNPRGKNAVRIAQGQNSRSRVG